MSLIGKILLVSIISTVALYGSLGASNPWPGFIVAWSAWGLFIWSIMRRGESRKQRRIDKEKERLIADILRRIDQQ